MITLESVERWERARSDLRALLHANEALMAERAKLRRQNKEILGEFVRLAGTFCADAAASS